MNCIDFFFRLYCLFHELCGLISWNVVLKKTICHKIHICNYCNLCEKRGCGSWDVLLENIMSTRFTFVIIVTFVKCVHVPIQICNLRKLFAARITWVFVFFVTMNALGVIIQLAMITKLLTANIAINTLLIFKPFLSLKYFIQSFYFVM